MDVSELFTADDEGVVVAVLAQPGAGRTEVVGRHGDALKVRVAAPPEKGRANRAITELLAHEFGLAAGAVTLLAGDHHRAKRVRLAGVDTAQASEALERLLGGAGTHGPKPRR